MTITSFNFFLFLIACVTLYYILPKKFQWVELLLFSLAFYYFAANPLTFGYVFFSTFMAWGITNGMERDRKKGAPRLNE